MKQKLYENEKADILHFEIFKCNSLKSIFKNLIFVQVLKSIASDLSPHKVSN